MQVKSASTAPCFRHSNCISNMIPSGFLVISDTMSAFTWFEIDESLLKEWLSEAVCVFSLPAT